MTISLVWPFLISIYPIWRPNSNKILNLLACIAHNENGNGKYPGLLLQKWSSCMGPQLLETAGCIIMTYRAFFIVTLISINLQNRRNIKYPRVLKPYHLGNRFCCLYLGFDCQGRRLNEISHVWPLLINPIWLPNSIDIFNLWACKAHNKNGNGKYPMLLSKTRPPLERRKTLGHLRSINPNMINHYASQSQTCQLLKILKNIFFFKQRKCEKWRNQVELIYKIHIDYREVVYIYIIPYICGVLGIAF